MIKKSAMERCRGSRGKGKPVKFVEIWLAEMTKDGFKRTQNVAKLYKSGRNRWTNNKEARSEALGIVERSWLFKVLGIKVGKREGAEVDG